MKKQIVFRVLICLFVFILVVVGLELIFSRIIPDMKLLKVLRQSAIPGLVYELNPGSKILFDGFVVRIKPTEVKTPCQFEKEQLLLATKI
jgi:hypothetical protein